MTVVDELSAKILRQIEFYFSDANLRRDKFLQGKLAESPRVPISTLLTFNRLKQLTTDESVIKDAISTLSTVLVVDEDCIMRKEAFSADAATGEQVALCTAYLNRIPATSTMEELTEILSQYGDVKMVRLPKTKEGDERSHRGFGFVEYATPEGVAKLVAAIPRKPLKAEEDVVAESGASEVVDEAAIVSEVKAEGAEKAADATTDEVIAEESADKMVEEPKADDDAAVVIKPMYALPLAEYKAWMAQKRGGRPDDNKAAAVEEPAKVHELGRLVRVTGDLTGATKHDLMDIFSPLGQVKYVDFYAPAIFATIRFASAEVAKSVVDVVSKGETKWGESSVVSAAVLKDDEQEAYWAKVNAAVAARGQEGQRRNFNDRKRKVFTKRDDRRGKKAKADQE